MMRAGHYTGTNSLRHPYTVNKVTNRALYLDQAASGHAQPFGITRMHPDRVLVGNLVEPLGIAGAAMNQGRQAEGRQQEHLALADIDVVAMNVALYICGDGIL